MRHTNFLKLLLLALAALSSFFVSCKKEDLDDNTSHVRIALTGARIDSTQNGSVLSRDITLMGTFTSPTDFKVSDYGIIFYSSSNADPDNAVDRASANQGRTTPGAFEFRFTADGKENLFVGLYAITKKGPIYSTGATKIQDILDGVAFLPRFVIAKGTQTYLDGETIDFGTIDANGFVTINLQFINPGNAPLFISDVKCEGIPACTLVNTAAMVSPLSSTLFPITFNTGNFNDGQSYTYEVTMNCNDSTRLTPHFYIEFVYDYTPKGILQLDDKGNVFPEGSTIDYSTTNSYVMKLTNIGDADLTINSISIASSDYSVSLFTNGTVISAGGYTNAQIERLNAPPLADATMIISTNIRNYTYILSTTPPGAPIYEFRESGNTFPDYQNFEFYGSTVKTFEILNTGNASLDGITVYSDNPNFLITSFPSSTSINGGGGTTSFTISCYSTADETGSLFVNTNNGGNHQYYLSYTDGTVTGTPSYELRVGGSPQPDNSTFDFSSISSLTFDIYNSGDAALTGVSIAIDNPVFYASSTPPTSIGPLTTEAFTINCSATTGTESATLTVYTDLGQHTYYLTYTAALPGGFEIRDENNIVVTNGVNVYFSNPSETKNWTFVNSGGTVITIGSFTADGGFSYTPPATTTVANGTSESFSITAPAGPSTGTLNIATSEGNFTCNLIYSP